MRLSNRNKTSIYHFQLSVLIILFLLGITVFFIEKSRMDFLGDEIYLFLLIPAALLYLYYLRGRQIFEYDSDGEALNFKNKNIVGFLQNEAKDEFPKYKLLHYEVINLFFLKRLYITISSKKSNSIILRYDISYISNKDIKDLDISLKKVVKANKENKFIEN